VIVYLPAGSVVLPALNANGILAITLWVLLVCALALMASTPASTAIIMMGIKGMLNNLFMVNLRMFGRPFRLHLFTRTFGPDPLTSPKHLL
jgi:hypothetical protein